MSLWAHIYLSGFVVTLFLSVFGASYSARTGRSWSDIQNVVIAEHVITAVVWPVFWVFLIVYTIGLLGDDE